MKRTPPPRSLRARALQWLAQREHSRLELRRKLLRAADEARRAVSEPAPGPMAAGAAHSGPGVVDSAFQRADADASNPTDPAMLEAEVDAVLDWLEAHRYLSTERFVESRVQARAARFGNLRIRHELGQHAVALGPDAARALAATELDRARAVRERKFGLEAPATAEHRARQARFLAARGFSTEAIRGALRAPERGDD